MNNGALISKRYARAFLNIFSFDSDILARIKEAILFLDQHDEVFLMLKIPLLDAEKKAQALEEYLIERFKLPDSFKQLIDMVILHKRSYLIKDILRWIVELYEEKAGIECFEVSSALPLADADIESIKQFLVDNTNHTIITQQKNDKELIAGIRLQSGQHLWEYSIRKQLAAVQKYLKE